MDVMRTTQTTPTHRDTEGMPATLLAEYPAGVTYMRPDGRRHTCSRDTWALLFSAVTA